MPKRHFRPRSSAYSRRVKKAAALCNRQLRLTYRLRAKRPARKARRKGLHRELLVQRWSWKKDHLYMVSRKL